MFKIHHIVCLILLLGLPLLAQSERGKGDFGDPIPIGVAWPFDSKNDLFREGVDMAVNEINEAGGVLGRPLEVTFADDGGKVGVGKGVAQQFADRKELVAVLGHYDSFIAEPASLTYEYNGLLMITPGATYPKLTQQGFKLVFRSIPDDTQVGAQLAEIAAKQGLKRMVIIHEQSNYGRQLANAIEFRGEEVGLRVADRISYDSGVQDFREIYAKMRLLDFEAVIFAGLAADGAELIAGARERNFNQLFLGGNGMDSPDIFRNGAAPVEGTLVLSVFDSENANPYVQYFNNRFQELHQRRPDAWAAQGYDVVQLLARGIRGAQSAEPSAIADALREVHHWYGVTGRHDFDEQGEIHNKPMVVKIARDGRLVYIRL